MEISRLIGGANIRNNYKTPKEMIEIKMKKGKIKMYRKVNRKKF